MKEKFMRFMYGRYGIDSFGKFLIIVAVITVFISNFTRSNLLATLSWVIIIWAYYRMFSKNIYKRSAENQKYLNKTYKIRCWFGKQKNLLIQRKTHHIYKCPTCKQKIRIPRGKGKIEIRCPKCNTTFIKRS
ncbi:MAG: hypothetical protein ACI4S2_18705 [Lachnospiraceae bacterium]